MAAQTFQKIQGKTLEQIQKNISRIVLQDLKDFIEQYSSAKVPKSSKRPAIEKVAQEIITSLLAKKAEGEKKANGKNQNPPKLSAKGWEAISKMRECFAAWEDDNMTVEELAAEVKHPEYDVQKTIQTLETDGFIMTIKDGYGLTELGQNAKAPGSKSNKKGTSIQAKGQTGPKSEYTGKKIWITVKDNPCREGSVRAKHFDIVKNGMLYKDYREMGGNNFNLQDGVLRGFFIMAEKNPNPKMQTVEEAVKNARKRITAINDAK